MQKIFATASDAIAGLTYSGMTVMVGGFGLCGVPETLVGALTASGADDLTIISNNAGIDGIGVGKLLELGRVRKVISSYIGENKLALEKSLSGELEVELAPQGTLAERIRAGGAGIPAFFTKTGVGTIVGEGKAEREFGGEVFLMETALTADLALVHAWKADSEGNLVFRKTARNFNPVMATAGKVTIAQVEHLVEVGDIDPDHIHTPGIFVSRVVHVLDHVKRIERRGPPPALAMEGHA